MKLFKFMLRAVIALGSCLTVGGIWTSQTAPTPRLNLALTNSNLEFSWIVPSTHFVLQQSPDLSSWTDVTNAPALNLANLHEEIVLPATNTSAFYRLESR